MFGRSVRGLRFGRQRRRRWRRRSRRNARYRRNRGGPAAAAPAATGGSDTGGGQRHGTETGDGTGSGGSIGGSIGGSVGGSVGGQAGVVTLQPWPTSDAVVAVDSVNQFTSNLSDLVYQAPSGGMGEVLWGLRNDPSTLYCLVWNGTTWSGMTDDGWTFGKTLRYPNGLGSPDAEGLTRASRRPPRSTSRPNATTAPAASAA